MLQVLHVDAVKVDPDVTMLHIIFLSVARFLSGCCVFNERLNVPCNMN